MSLTWLDWFVMLLYFAFVIGVGISLRRSTTTSVEFFQAGRAIPAWVCGLAFISAQSRRSGNHRHGGVRREVRHRDESLLLDWRDPGNGVPRHFHDAVLLRIARAIGTRISPSEVRRE